MSTTIEETTTTEPTGWRRIIHQPRYRMMAFAMIGVVSMSLGRVLSGNDDLTSSGTFGVALRTAAPIALAGLAGLFSERSGTVNIGLEGMMIMGTIFAGWWGWEFGPWMAVVGGIVGGVLAGLLMSLATTTFGVNHIVAGFAINILAPGVARFMSNELFTGVPGGSVTSSPGNSGSMGRFTMPFLSGGDLFGWTTPDMFGWFERQGWFVLADAAGLLGGLTSEVTYDVVLTILLFIGAGYVLWHTSLGLRLRAAGERPAAADSLGVSVTLMRHAGLAISGGLAGLGGAVLVLFANRYQENQVAGRGFLGLATLIFGNWRPVGIAAGAGLFGYAQGVTLRTNPDQVVRALLLAAAIGLTLSAVWMLATRNLTGLGIAVLIAVALFWGYYVAERPNNQLVFVTPYVVTLVAVSVGAQRLRPPAEEGIPWIKGNP
ncbi:MAG: ABC transporter permease [Ilumatobacteraceae bacterium]